MPANSLSLRCVCGHDLTTGPVGVKGFLLRTWPWAAGALFAGVLIFNNLSVISSINPEKILYAGLVGAIKGAILGVVLWGISKLASKSGR